MKVSFILATIAVGAHAFSPTTPTLQQQRLKPLRGHITGDNVNESSLTTASTSRRSFFNDIAAFASAGVTLATVNSIHPSIDNNNVAWASGGATAGGAYLLSAKQRYNERVIAGIKELLDVVDSLKSGSLDSARAYFIARDDTGSWKDATAAGYLLSNAFRTNSSTPPDRLPAVKVSLLKYCIDILAFCGFRGLRCLVEVVSDSITLLYFNLFF